MGESDDANDDQDENVALDMRNIVNLAKLFGTLIVDGGLGFGVLKNLNLTYLQPKTKIFMEVLFITILLQSQRESASKRDEQAVVNVFMRVNDTTQLTNGMQYFLKKVVNKTDIAGGKEEKKTVKWACKVASGTLEALVAINTVKK
jgi:nucleolar MIF4G domain-containing protein 1